MLFNVSYRYCCAERRGGALLTGQAMGRKRRAARYGERGGCVRLYAVPTC